MQQEGEIVKWVDASGFGFINRPGINSDIYAHVTGFVPGHVPYVGAQVKFSIGERHGKYGKRPIALRIKVISKP
jgi:cold shock CspA family protein